MHTKALVFTAPQIVALQSVEVPEPGPDEVLIKTSFTLIPGDALAGIVIASGERSELSPGTRVLYSGSHPVLGAERGAGGHVGHVVCLASDVVALPVTVSLRDAALAALAGIAWRGATLSRPQKGETVFVIGLGPIGVLSARIHALSGARVIGADLRPERAALLAKNGMEAVFGDGLVDQLRARAPGGADVIVDATGEPGMLESAIGLAKDIPPGASEQPGARYVLQGSYPGDLPLPFQAAFRKELTFLVPRSTRPQDIRHTLEHIAQKKLVVHDLFLESFPPEDVARAYAFVAQGDADLQTILVEWSRL